MVRPRTETNDRERRALNRQRMRETRARQREDRQQRQDNPMAPDVANQFPPSVIVEDRERNQYDRYARDFESFQNNMKIHECNICNEDFFDVTLQSEHEEEQSEEQTESICRRCFNYQKKQKRSF